MSDQKQSSGQIEEPNIPELVKARIAALQQVERCWKIEPRASKAPLPAFLARPLTAMARWLIRGTVDEQNTFNAQLLQVLYRFSEEADGRQKMLNQTTEAFFNMTITLERHHEALDKFQDDLLKTLDSLHESFEQIQERTAATIPSMIANIERLNEAISDLKVSIAYLEQAQTDLAARIALYDTRTDAQS